MAKKATIAGNTFLFTGKLTEFTREDAEAHVEAEGGKVLSGVSAKLNYLVVGEDAGSKLAKAKALGTVTILHEKEFLKMMSSGKKTPTKAAPKKTVKATAKAAPKKLVKVPQKALATVVKTPKKGNSKKKEHDTLREIIFARNSSTNLANCHGIEITIAKLDEKDLVEIAELIEDKTYLLSSYFKEFYSWDGLYHSNGVFFEWEDINSLDDDDDLTSTNIEIGKVKYNKIEIDKKGIFLCSFRNETIYLKAKGLTSKKGLIKVDCYVDSLSFLEDSGANICLLNKVMLQGKELERNSGDEESSGEIYDTNQFLIFNNKIVFYATNGDYEQYPFDDLVDQILLLEKNYKNHKKLMNVMGKILPQQVVSKKPTSFSKEKTQAIRQITRAGMDQNFFHFVVDALNTKWGGDEDVVMAAVNQFPEAFKYASNELKAENKVVLAVVTQAGHALEFASKKLQADKNIVLAAVSQNGKALEFASKELRTAKEIVLAAVTKGSSSYFSALQYASDKLKDDKEIVLAAVTQDGYAIQHASKKLQADKDIVLVAVTGNGNVLDYVAKAVREDKVIVLAAVTNSGEALSYASKKLQADKNIVLAAVSQNGNALEYASIEIKEVKEIVLTAVTNNGGALQYASAKLKDDKEIVLAAVTNVCNALDYASAKLKDDKEIVLAAVKKGYPLGFISKKLQADKDVIKAAKSKK